MSSAATPSATPLSLHRIALLLALPIAVHVLSVPPAEPVFCGDSNRHVMTSIFFRDFLADGLSTDPKGYAERYYEQYPALGLMVWPPLFHGVCGTLMLVFGTSVDVARALVLASFLSSVWCVHRIARRAFDDDRALATTVLFSVSPLIFDYGRDVMLEVPALALVLWSVDQFDLWLRSGRNRCLYLASVTAALAALTRFDAAVLLPFYVALLCFRGGWSRLFNRHVLAAIAVAVCLVGPVYLVIAKETGELHMRQATASVGGSEDGSANGFLAWKNWTYYPLSVVEQCGWPIAILCAIGLLGSFGRTHRRERDVLWALLLATYVTLSPLAELRARHAIYWVPAIVGFAACGMEQITVVLARLQSRVSRRKRASTIESRGSAPITPSRGGIVVAAWSAMFVATAAAAMNQPHYRVTGYAAAAQLAISETAAGDAVFFDGWWDGNFTYHLRHLDATRSRSVIRGDRLLYDFVCIPDTDFQSHAVSEVQILETLMKANPAIVVIENPQFFRQVEIAQRLRNLVAAEPRVFEPLRVIPVESSLTHLPTFQLEVYRFNRNAARDEVAQLLFALPDSVLDVMDSMEETKQFEAGNVIVMSSDLERP